MRKPGAFGRLLQMKPFLDLEQPFDAHAPGEVAGPFEANDPSVGRNNRVGPARSPVGTEEFFRIGGVALEPHRRVPVAIAAAADESPPDRTGVGSGTGVSVRVDSGGSGAR